MCVAANTDLEQLQLQLILGRSKFRVNDLPKFVSAHFDFGQLQLILGSSFRMRLVLSTLGTCLI